MFGHIPRVNTLLFYEVLEYLNKVEGMKNVDLTAATEHIWKTSNINTKAGPWFITDAEGPSCLSQVIFTSMKTELHDLADNKFLPPLLQNVAIRSIVTGLCCHFHGGGEQQSTHVVAGWAPSQGHLWHSTSRAGLATSTRTAVKWRSQLWHPVTSSEGGGRSRQEDGWINNWELVNKEKKSGASWWF